MRRSRKGLCSLTDKRRGYVNHIVLIAIPEQRAKSVEEAEVVSVR
jgi:hypothetical protein